MTVTVTTGDIKLFLPIYLIPSAGGNDTLNLISVIGDEYYIRSTKANDNTVESGKFKFIRYLLCYFI